VYRGILHSGCTTWPGMTTALLKMVVPMGSVIPNDRQQQQQLCEQGARMHEALGITRSHLGPTADVLQ
jgi:hypothetical protein